MPGKPRDLKPADVRQVIRREISDVNAVPTKFILRSNSNRLRVCTILVFDETSNICPANDAHEQRAFSEFYSRITPSSFETFAHRSDDSIAFKVITCA
jgi:hypothetical protein